MLPTVSHLIWNTVNIFLLCSDSPRAESLPRPFVGQCKFGMRAFIQHPSRSHFFPNQTETEPETGMIARHWTLQLCCHYYGSTRLELEFVIVEFVCLSLERTVTAANPDLWSNKSSQWFRSSSTCHRRATCSGIWRFYGCTVLALRIQLSVWPSRSCRGIPLGRSVDLIQYVMFSRVNFLMDTKIRFASCMHWKLVSTVEFVLWQSSDAGCKIWIVVYQSFP